MKGNKGKTIMEQHCTLSTDENITEGTTGTALAISRTKKSATLFILEPSSFNTRWIPSCVKVPVG